MELNISNAVIEVTRKCNLKCEHCLRGCSQNKTIPDHYIYKFLRLIDSIGTLTVTGGEPTLAMDALEHLRHCIVYQDCSVESFFMATNGKSIPVDRVAAWAYDMHNCCDDNELSSIGFSFDDYHTETLNYSQARKQVNNYDRLKRELEEKYGLYDTPGGGYFVNRHTDRGYQRSLIKEGRAKDFGDRDNDINIFEKWEYQDGDSINFSETELYLSSNGWIVAGCNWSYDSIDHKKEIQICHIDNIDSTDQLIKAILDYNRRIEGVDIDETELMKTYEAIPVG